VEVGLFGTAAVVSGAQGFYHAVVEPRCRLTREQPQWRATIPREVARNTQPQEIPGNSPSNISHAKDQCGLSRRRDKSRELRQPPHFFLIPPANSRIVLLYRPIRREGGRWSSGGSILFSFDIEYTRRVKAGRRTNPGRGNQRRAFTLRQSQLERRKNTAFALVGASPLLTTLAG
jgi:hypothetical protein